MPEKGYVYFMTNANNKSLYIGVTSDLTKRVLQHKNHQYEGFTDKYNCTKLVYYEECLSIKDAFLREKQVQGWSHKKRQALINMKFKSLKEFSKKEFRKNK